MLRTHRCRYKCFPVWPRAQHLLRTQKLFLILFRNILCPQQKFPSLRSMETRHSFPCVCAPKKHHEQQCVRTMCPRLPGPFTLSDTSRLRFALQQYPISIKERRFVSSKALWNYTRLEPALHPSGSCLSELTTGSLRHARKFVIKSGA